MSTLQWKNNQQPIRAEVQHISGSKLFGGVISRAQLQGTDTNINILSIGLAKYSFSVRCYGKT